MSLRNALTLILSALLAVSSCQCLKSDVSAAQTKSFALFYTTSMHGWVEPCGCTSEPLGGIARLASVVSAARENYGLGTALIDGGDLLFDTLKAPNPADLCQENARIDLLLSALKDLSFVGTFPGPYDDVMGEAFRDEKLKRHNLPNIKTKAQNGFLMGSDSFKLGVLFIDESNASAIDQKALSLKNQGAKAVVAVTHLPKDFFQVKQLALGHLDVIILGTTNEEMPDSQKLLAEGPVFVSAAKQGQYLGLIEFQLNQNAKNTWKLDDRKVQRELRVSLLTQRSINFQTQIDDTTDAERKKYLKAKIDEASAELSELKAEKDQPLTDENYLTATTVALSRKITPHAIYESRVKAYENEIPKLVAQCESGIECPKLAQGQAHFVGAETCKNCHAPAYDFWKKAVYSVSALDEKGNSITRLSGHTKAYETLQEKQKAEDRSCIECHTAGFMQPGGFCKVKEVGPFKGVQCESCHGAGSLHAASADKTLIKRNVPEETCRGCHHVPHIATTESFVYEQKLTKILGPGHGELLLSKIKHHAQN